MAQKIVPSLPRIKAHIGHIPQRLKALPFEPPRARLEVLRAFLTRLIREERSEMKYNRAEELRPYVERVSLIFFIYENLYFLVYSTWCASWIPR